MLILLTFVLHILHSATPDSESIALEVYDGREVYIYLNVWNTQEHAPQLGEGFEYAQNLRSEISQLIEINDTRVEVTDITLCFDLEVDVANCQKVYNSNPNVTIPFEPLSDTDSTHWSILLSFSFLIGADRTATYYALYLQNAIQDRSSYLYDGDLAPLATEHGRIEYYTMTTTGAYFFQGPEEPETCTSEQSSLISECTLMTLNSECASNANCLWSSTCASFSPPIVSVPNCLPLVHCIHSSLHTDYTITYQHNSCPYLTQPSQTTEDDWGKDLADDVEYFFDNVYLVVLTVVLFLMCVTVCLYFCVRHRTKKRWKKVKELGEKPKMRDHPQKRAPRPYYPSGPSTVVTDAYRSETTVRPAPSYSFAGENSRLGPTPGHVQNYPHSMASISSYSPQIHSSSRHRHDNISYV